MRKNNKTAKWRALKTFTGESLATNITTKQSIKCGRCKFSCLVIFPPLRKTLFSDTQFKLKNMQM